MDISKVLEAIEQNGFTTKYFETAEEAVQYLESRLHGKTIGFGDSHTLLAMNLFERLAINNQVFDPQHCQEGRSFDDTAKICLTTDIFITSLNAIAASGELINIDGKGNRVAGSLYGHEKVYFVAGTNKIAPSLEEAIWRARNIAAPRNAKRKGFQTPCAEKGDRCYNCSSPDRICNGLIIHYKKMHHMDMEVILINQELGF